MLRRGCAWLSAAAGRGRGPASTRLDRQGRRPSRRRRQADSPSSRGAAARRKRGDQCGDTRGDRAYPQRGDEKRRRGADGPRRGPTAGSGRPGRTATGDLNLILNAIEAMSATSEGPRELLITTIRTSWATCSSPCAIRARTAPAVSSTSSRPSIRPSRRPGAGAVDLPLDDRGAWGTTVGERQYAPRRGLPIHVAVQFVCPIASLSAACAGSDAIVPLSRRPQSAAYRSSIGPILKARSGSTYRSPNRPATTAICAFETWSDVPLR